jgi:transcriptional regulator with PAS, ATPase and Fis domain
MENLQSIKQRYAIIGHSPLLDRALNTAIRVASTDLSTLITGESGVGKEVFSKIIHGLSARKHQKFIAINCGAIPEGTINSELFGHEKGAFTGAVADRKGYFETYDGGTIFLDEIGELPLDTQAYLLRVLESGEYIRVGSSNVLKTNVRIIAATNVNLSQNIKKNKFREDLFYRLNSVTIPVPALRERPEDIYMLFRRFTVDFSEKYRTPPIQLDENAIQLLQQYSWPGNIRELKNVAGKVSVMTEDRLIGYEKLMEIVPTLRERNLPVSSKENGNFEGTGFQEREILYKVLFDMKKDLTDLKGLIFEIIRNNDLQVKDINQLKTLEDLNHLNNFSNPNETFHEKPYVTPLPSQTPGDYSLDEEFQDINPSKPFILQPNSSNRPTNYGNAEVLDESLRMDDQEKILILKALKKFKGRRKEAALELGISERTLYRKIKQYDLE